MPSRLQLHYNKFRLEGGNHVLYLIQNDINEEMGADLKRNFEEMHPEGVDPEKIKEFNATPEDEVN